MVSVGLGGWETEECKKKKKSPIVESQELYTTKSDKPHEKE